MPARPTLLALAVVLFAPLAAASHPVDADPAALAREGAEIVVTIEVSGDYSGSGSAREDTNGGEQFVATSGTVRGSYAWASTAFLQPGATTDEWTHRDLPWANVTASHRFTSDGENAQGVGTEYEVHGYSERTCSASGIQRLQPRVLGRIDETKRAIVLRFEYMQLFNPSGLPWTCSGSDTGYNGEVTEHDILPPGFLPGAPLIQEAIAAAAPGREARDVQHLTIEVPLAAPKQIILGSVHAGTSDGDRRDPATYYCGSYPFEPSGTCNAGGSVNVQVWVNPCKATLASYERHLTEVKALVPPAKGSSEAQVRAFAVDAGQKIRATLADLRALQLACAEPAEDAMATIVTIAGQLSASWLDVEKTHGLSRDGVRDALAAERTAQLLGADGIGDVSPYLAAAERYQGAPGSTQKGSVKTHSPVSLHAWDAEGRHVGWDAATGAPDVEVDGAAYEGKPGDAQTLTLPPGVYRLQAEEIAPGAYTLNVTIANESEHMPLRSAPGGSSSMIVLVQDDGGLAFAAARGVSQPGYLAPAAIRAAAAPPPGAQAPATGSNAIPAASVALVAAAVVLAARRRP